MKAFIVLLIAGGTAVSMAQAGNFSFQGTFLTDDQVQLFNFTLSDTTQVTFQTWGYGGGTNADNISIPAGGFESLVSWFGPDGSFLGDSGSYGCGSGNSYLFDCLDAFADPTLAAGTYTAALTVWDNASLGTGSPGDLALGFQDDGIPDFTVIGTCTEFCDTQENQDNGNWALDISGVDTASSVSSAPEPVTLLLSGSSLALIGLGLRGRSYYRGEKSKGLTQE